MGRLLSVYLILFSSGAVSAEVNSIYVGSKNFTEQFILAEIIAQYLEGSTELNVERKINLAGTQFSMEALKSGEIDLYPEYTGTGLVTVLKRKPISDPLRVRSIVTEEFRKRFHLEWLAPFGFNNTYALAVRRSDDLFGKIQTISQLKQVADQIVFGATHEFFERPDGYRALSEHYEISVGERVGLDPGLMYRAIAEKQVNMISAFSTDGRIEGFKLRLLKDDKGFFPPYEAAILIRKEILNELPRLAGKLVRLSGKISNEDMTRMNYEVDSLGMEPKDVAEKFLIQKKLKEGVLSDAESVSSRTDFWTYLWSEKANVFRLIQEHLYLVLMSMVIALCLGVPLGIALTRIGVLQAPVFGFINTMQTVPSLALLGFLIPLLGIGTIPAVVALFAYALLPLVRNTFTGIRGVDRDVVDAARGIGLTENQILWRVELPLALPTMMAGVRTSTVLVVGTATLVALIGAGGLGDPIFRGIAAVNANLILMGALPAALLALILDRALHWIEQALLPEGKIKRRGKT